MKRLANLNMVLMALVLLFVLIALALFFFKTAVPPVEVGETVAKESLYQVEAQFLDQDSRPLAFRSLLGTPLVVSMYYASCPFACPVLLAKLKMLDAGLSLSTRKKTKYLLISFDPERDTPAKVKKLALDYKLDEKRWRLVQAKENDAQIFAALLGVTYRKLQDGEFSHNTIITLLDKEGVIDQQIDGQQTVPEDFSKRIEQLVQP